MLYKSKILTLVTIVYSCCMMMSIVIGPKWPFYSCCDYIGLLGTGFMQVLYLGRDQNNIYKFKALLPKDYYLIPGNDAKNL